MWPRWPCALCSYVPLSSAYAKLSGRGPLTGRAAHWVWKTVTCKLCCWVATGDSRRVHAAASELAPLTPASRFKTSTREVSELIYSRSRPGFEPGAATCSAYFLSLCRAASQRLSGGGKDSFLFSPLPNFETECNALASYI